MIVDQHLTWDLHIKSISSKIAKNIGVIHRVSHKLPSAVRTQLYYSLIYPYLSYCSIVWASTYASRLRKLLLLQKRAVRTITGAAWYSHTDPIFLHHKILKIDQIRNYQVGLFMYMFTRNLLPLKFRLLIKNGADLHSHDTRNVAKYRRVYARTNTRNFFISVIGPQFWNALPLSLQQVGSLLSFKRLLRQYLVETNC